MEKNKTIDYLLIRNVLNILFILLVIAFFILYFISRPRPFENYWCVGVGVVGIFIKMVESVIRVMENVKRDSNKKFQKSDNNEN